MTCYLQVIKQFIDSGLSKEDAISKAVQIQFSADYKAVIAKYRAIQANKQVNDVCPNNRVDDGTVREIKDMSDKYSIRYISKKTGLHVNTVRKYTKDEQIPEDRGMQRIYIFLYLFVYTFQTGSRENVFIQTFADQGL